MKILQIISQLGNGGAEKLVVELSNELAKDNEVTLLSFRKIEPWMFFPKRLKSTVSVVALNKQSGFNPLFVYSLYRILKEKKPEVVHMHLSSSLQYCLFLVPFFKNITFIHTLHSEFKYSEKMFRQLSKLWFFKKIRFVCLSDNIKENYKIAFKSFSFTTIPNGIEALKSSSHSDLVKEEIERVKESKDDKIFLFVGRLGEEKNIPLLVNLFSKLNNCKLLIIGVDPSPKGEVLAMINKYKSNNIIYLGAKENVQDYMRNSNALVLASFYEGLPMVVLEALSLGLAVISTPVGSLPKIIKNGENGFLSTEINEVSYRRVLELFLNLEQENIEYIKRNNINLFNKNYSIDICTKAYKKLYIKGIL